MADYFTRFLPPPSAIAATHRKFIAVYETYAKLGRADPLAAAQARLIGAAYQDFQADLVVISERVAEAANHAIVELYEKSRVRPHTGNAPHLVEALPTSEPLKTVLPAGAVGIVNRDALDKFPYWAAQEFGSSHLVGKEIRGWFFGTGFSGAFAPDPAESRHHPLFRPSGTGLVAHIQKPIPEGKFIRETADLAFALWSHEMRAAALDAAKDLRAAAGQGRRSATSRRARGRRKLNLKGLKRIPVVE